VTRVPDPRDPRTAPFERLRSLMPLVVETAQAQAETEADRKLLHRIDLGEAVRR
jgi:hypothetical protein